MMRYYENVVLLSVSKVKSSVTFVLFTNIIPFPQLNLIKSTVLASMNYSVAESLLHYRQHHDYAFYR